MGVATKTFIESADFHKGCQQNLAEVGRRLSFGVKYTASHQVHGIITWLTLFVRQSLNGCSYQAVTEQMTVNIIILAHLRINLGEISVTS
jgi:hypothetical protein